MVWARREGGHRDRPSRRRPITFETDPAAYRHWRWRRRPVATLTMGVDPDGGLRDDYELKLNSYDLGVDIELHDAVQRLRFEHPEVKAVVVTGGLDKVFCAGANIQMLAGSTHAHKVNFCKFTNETRNGIEDATAQSGQVWIAAVNGTAAGGGYELALACDEILLVDDRSSAVSLPEVPLLAVLPGTGGLTRVVDKRHVRRDLADVFATRAEGIKGRAGGRVGPGRRRRAPQPLRRAGARAGRGARGRVRPPGRRPGRRARAARASTATTTRCATATSTSPSTASSAPPPSPSTARPAPSRRPPTSCSTRRRGLAARRRPRARRRHAAPALQRARARHLGAAHRAATRRRCSPPRSVLRGHADHWLVAGGPPATGPARSSASTSRPARSSRWSSRAAASPARWPSWPWPPTARSCSTARDPTATAPPATLRLTEANDGWYPMANGLSRLATRFWGRRRRLDAARAP